MVNTRQDCGDCDHARECVPLNECMAVWPYCRHRLAERLNGYQNLGVYVGDENAAVCGLGGQT